MQEVPVLVVGGSLVGLSASLFLAWRGVPHVLVDRHEGSSPHPRAMGFTERTMEHFQAVGLGPRIPQMDPGVRLRRAVVESLAGPWHRETEWTPGGQAAAGTGDVTPHTGAAIAQDRLEPLLREQALALGAELRLGTELLSFTQDDAGVTAVLRERASGALQTVRAQWLVAADGASSGIREALGIPRDGVGALGTVSSVLFRCAEADRHLARGVQQFEIEQPGLRAFLTTYGDGRWVLMRTDGQPLDEDPRPFIHRCLGEPLPVEVIATGCWELAGRIAGSYRQGRVFLAGDAAHQLPPTRGGFGANTGIDDAWNLAWKLALVVEGRAAPALLDTYDAERRPIGWLRHDQTFARPDYARWLDDAASAPALIGDVALELGQLHRSSAIVGAGPDLPAAAHPEDWAGQPGVRAPHVAVRQDGEPRSTLDLVGRDFTLLCEDGRWADAARRAAEALGLRLDTVVVGRDVEAAPDAFRRAFGIGATGASLVRPDGIVGWRSVAGVADPEAVLRDVLGQLVGRTA